jgi:hypothetical protein
MLLLCQRKTRRSVVPTKGRQSDWHDLADGHTGNGAYGRVPYSAIPSPECQGLATGAFILPPTHARRSQFCGASHPRRQTCRRAPGQWNFDYSAFVGLEYTAIQPVKQPG